MRMRVKEDGRLVSSDAPKAPGYLESCHLPSLLLGSEHSVTRVWVLSDLGILSQVSLSSAGWELQLLGMGRKRLNRSLTQTTRWKAMKFEQIWRQEESRVRGLEPEGESTSF